MTRLFAILRSSILSLTLAGNAAAFDLEARKRDLPWIWSPPQPSPPPEAGGVPASTDIDRFLAARLTAAGITPSPPADDLTWLRRVHFAITGLPPGHHDQRAFLADTAAGRRERVVDALLASPHFGERWARHWMDLVRYAESRGHEEDFAIANAWRYRDYLVRALNADVRYDQFVTEHIAGDLIPPRIDPSTGANESVLATGWAFLGEENHSPVDIRLDDCERLDNKVDVLTKTFLGLTIACARCHDHKFDAISQRDYYALAGILASSPYRQARFETSVSHARLAERLDALRAEHAGAIARALAASVRPGLRDIPQFLDAARARLHGAGPSAGVDAARVDAWSRHLEEASRDSGHVLHRLGLAALASGSEGTAPTLAAPTLAAAAESAEPSLPADAVVIADYTAPGRSPWKTDGPTFGLRPRVAGELRLGSAAHPVTGVLTQGAAVRDPFWNRLALAPGNEMDSGSLAAAARAGKSIVTRITTLKTGRLHYLLRGRATVYAGVDSHLMIAGPLHGALVAHFDTGGRTAWVTHDLSAYAGHRAHLEFAPQEGSELEVLMAVDSEHPPSWLTAPVWWPDSPTTDWQSLARAFQADMNSAMDGIVRCAEAPEAHPLAPRFAALAHWAVQHPDLVAASPPPDTRETAAFFQRRDELAASVRWESATAVTLSDGTGVDLPVLARGKPTSPEKPAPRGLPDAFGQPRLTDSRTSGRAELARQMTDPSNPLVARVIVNRVWHHIFGRGLVATVDNFGVLGDRPTHPELLDHLAWQFTHDDQWSIKRLVRRLVLTDAFARSSRTVNPRAGEIDPSNTLLHRMPVRRLEGEAIRDAALAISGRLDPTVGGPPVAIHLTEFTVGRGSPHASGPLDGAGRRSLYLATRRNFLPTFLVAFDFPTPFSTVGKRTVTNVPAQALAMTNDPMLREQAGVWAARLLKELPQAGTAQRITWLVEGAFARPPLPGEVEAVQATLADLQSQQGAASESEAWAEVCHALMAANDFIHLK